MVWLVVYREGSGPVKCVGFESRSRARRFARIMRWVPGATVCAPRRQLVYG